MTEVHEDKLVDYARSMGFTVEDVWKDLRRFVKIRRSAGATSGVQAQLSL